MEWAEEQHFNYLMQVIGKVNEDDDEDGKDAVGVQMNDNDALQSMGLI